MKARSIVLAAFPGLSGYRRPFGRTGTVGSLPRSSPQSLKAPSEFESIGDRGARSRAMFEEIGKVLTHPRCMNCHPAGAHPLQGAGRHEHMPPAWREDVGYRCDRHHLLGLPHRRELHAVHRARTYKSIPGHPRWGLAPLSMAWQGKTIGDICRQVKDMNLNGGRDLTLLQEHIAKDDLVAWGWNPGPGREPAPGTQGGRRQVGSGLDRYRRGMSVERALDQAPVAPLSSARSRFAALRAQILRALS